jgi:hypothetical protein
VSHAAMRYVPLALHAPAVLARPNPPLGSFCRADNYYLLPFCKPKPVDKPRHKWRGLGEVLQGNELIDSQLELKFRTDLPKREICTMSLDDDKVCRAAACCCFAGLLVQVPGRSRHVRLPFSSAADGCVGRRQQASELCLSSQITRNAQRCGANRYRAVLQCTAGGGLY